MKACYAPQESYMSAKRLGRLAGLVLALAAVFGGVAGLGGHPSDVSTGAVYQSNNIIEWD